MVSPEIAREEAQQAARAAAALLATQHLAEGIRLAHRALAAAQSRLADAEAREAAAMLEDLRQPRLDREVSRAHVATAERALALIETLEAPVRARGQRIAAYGIGAALVVLGALALLRPGPEVEARASAVYGSVPTQSAGSVIDGDPLTNWLLPDRTEGWVELRYRAPRAVSAVEIINGHNAPYEDRAAREIEVMLFDDGGGILATATAELPFGGGPQRIEIAASGVARLRVYVRSWHRSGGALDEVRALP